LHWSCITAALEAATDSGGIAGMKSKWLKGRNFLGWPITHMGNRLDRKAVTSVVTPLAAPLWRLCPVRLNRSPLTRVTAAQCSSGTPSDTQVPPRSASAAETSRPHRGPASASARNAANAGRPARNSEGEISDESLIRQHGGDA
jgi:hypothetical protein